MNPFLGPASHDIEHFPSFTDAALEVAEEEDANKDQFEWSIDAMSNLYPKEFRTPSQTPAKREQGLREWEQQDKARAESYFEHGKFTETPLKVKQMEPATRVLPPTPAGRSGGNRPPRAPNSGTTPMKSQLTTPQRPSPAQVTPQRQPPKSTLGVPAQAAGRMAAHSTPLKAFQQQESDGEDEEQPIDTHYPGNEPDVSDISPRGSPHDSGDELEVADEHDHHVPRVTGGMHYAAAAASSVGTVTRGGGGPARASGFDDSRAQRTIIRADNRADTRTTVVAVGTSGRGPPARAEPEHDPFEDSEEADDLVLSQEYLGEGGASSAAQAGLRGRLGRGASAAEEEDLDREGLNRSGEVGRVWRRSYADDFEEEDDDGGHAAAMAALRNRQAGGGSRPGSSGGQYSDLGAGGASAGVSAPSGGKDVGTRRASMGGEPVSYATAVAAQRMADHDYAEVVSEVAQEEFAEDFVEDSGEGEDGDELMHSHPDPRRDGMMAVGTQQERSGEGSHSHSGELVQSHGSHRSGGGRPGSAGAHRHHHGRGARPGSTPVEEGSGGEEPFYDGLDSASQSPPSLHRSNSDEGRSNAASPFEAPMSREALVADAKARVAEGEAREREARERANNSLLAASANNISVAQPTGAPTSNMIQPPDVSAIDPVTTTRLDNSDGKDMNETGALNGSRASLTSSSGRNRGNRATTPEQLTNSDEGRRLKRSLLPELNSSTNRGQLRLSASGRSPNLLSGELTPDSAREFEANAAAATAAAAAGVNTPPVVVTPAVPEPSPSSNATTVAAAPASIPPTETAIAQTAPAKDSPIPSATDTSPPGQAAGRRVIFPAGLPKRDTPPPAHSPIGVPRVITVPASGAVTMVPTTGAIVPTTAGAYKGLDTRAAKTPSPTVTGPAGARRARITPPPQAAGSIDSPGARGSPAVAATSTSTAATAPVATPSASAPPAAATTFTAVSESGSASLAASSSMDSHMPPMPNVPYKGQPAAFPFDDSSRRYDSPQAGGLGSPGVLPPPPAGTAHLLTPDYRPATEAWRLSAHTPVEASVGDVVDFPLLRLTPHVAPHTPASVRLARTARGYTPMPAQISPPHLGAGASSTLSMNVTPLAPTGGFSTGGTTGRYVSPEYASPTPPTRFDPDALFVNLRARDATPVRSVLAPPGQTTFRAPLDGYLYHGVAARDRSGRRETVLPARSGTGASSATSSASKRGTAGGGTLLTRELDVMARELAASRERRQSASGTPKAGSLRRASEHTTEHWMDVLRSTRRPHV